MDLLMQPYQQRVIAEQQQLQERLDGLSAYLSRGKAENVTDSEWEDLILQEEAMDTYNVILNRRISKFN